jgi:hypothetical protein
MSGCYKIEEFKNNDTLTFSYNFDNNINDITPLTLTLVTDTNLSINNNFKTFKYVYTSKIISGNIIKFSNNKSNIIYYTATSLHYTNPCPIKINDTYSNAIIIECYSKSQESPLFIVLPVSYSIDSPNTTLDSILNNTFQSTDTIDINSLLTHSIFYNFKSTNNCNIIYIDQPINTSVTNDLYNNITGTLSDTIIENIVYKSSNYLNNEFDIPENDIYIDCSPVNTTKSKYSKQTPIISNNESKNYAIYIIVFILFIVSVSQVFFWTTGKHIIPAFTSLFKPKEISPP